MIKKWKVLHKRDVSPSKWFPVEHYSVELSNKQVIDDFFIAPFPNVVVVLPITKTNEVVLVNQYKHGAGEVLLELPGGFQQEGKTVEQSALAELEEEVGILTEAKNLTSLGTIASNPTKTRHITHGFLARNLEFNSHQKLDPTEDIELFKVSPNELIKMVSKGEVRVGDTVAFIMKAYILFPELFK